MALLGMEALHWDAGVRKKPRLLVTVEPRKKLQFLLKTCIQVKMVKELQSHQALW